MKIIKKLRIKFVVIVTGAVFIILAAIFISMIITTYQNNIRFSVNMLHQAMLYQANRFPDENAPRHNVKPAMPSPALVIEIDDSGNVEIVANYYKTIAEEIEPIAGLIFKRTEDIGVLEDYNLRYMKNGNRAAMMDISIERETLRSQILNSILICGAAMIVFFFLSVFLARWATRPIAAAWERQKQFIADASHELKTPLTVILSNADILRKNDARAEHIYFESVRMKKLVEDMLILAKSDNSEPAVIHNVTDFSDIVKSAVLTYEPIAYDNLESKLFSYEVEENLFVMGDVSPLRQLVYILFDNAVKYSPKGSVIRVKLSKHDHRLLLLTVTNDGDVIPKDELENIFLRFYRRDESRSSHGSFGLGLSIAQSIVNEHKGKIWAESDERIGNSFYITLPLK